MNAMTGRTDCKLEESFGGKVVYGGQCPPKVTHLYCCTVSTKGTVLE